MKIGIVGYLGSGKSTLFHWLTGESPDPALAHTSQSAMAVIPDERVAGLCDVYSPKKVTRAALEIVDTPGLSRSHEGSAARLAAIREAGCLVIVIAAYGGNDAAGDLSSFDDDLLIADLDIVSGRVERLRDSVKRPRPNREEQQKELQALEPLLAMLDEGRPLRGLELTPDQEKAIRSFQLLTDKPRLVIFNVDEDDRDEQKYKAYVGDQAAMQLISLGMEVELQQMELADRAEFCREMGVAGVDRDALIRMIMDVSGQMLFFTAGEKEVRTWLIHRGGTAVEAADGIHTDLARGFIRAETMNCDDLIRLGSEREVKAQNLARKEHRDYVIQDGDILNIHHN